MRHPAVAVAAAHVAHERIEAFLWGLLPDNDVILERWGKRFHVSPRNPFSLLSHVGEDCAGAVQFVLPQRLEHLDPGRPPEVDWIDETAVEQRLESLLRDPSASRTGFDAGQFSLAGAQAKTALLFGVTAVVSLLRTHSSSAAEDAGTFIDALLFNWLIAGTDGHAKNYSILHSGGGRVRLTRSTTSRAHCRMGTSTRASSSWR
jgi:serine/threonine protein kinase HipA of HipAB toxin-antitoxin module